jgi:hypothetical protein
MIASQFYRLIERRKDSSTTGTEDFSTCSKLLSQREIAEQDPIIKKSIKMGDGIGHT